MKIKAVVLIGPTGAGKTELSLQIAENNFQIISTDSVQIYRYLDIGSSKPSIQQRALVAHYLIDIVNPDYKFTAGDFCVEAEKACNEIELCGRFPLFAGGCAFYADAFFTGLSDIPTVGLAVREQLYKELDERGLSGLYEELKRCDSIFAGTIHPNDKQRILRGLEVYRGTGKPLSGYFTGRNSRGSSDTLFIGIHLERDDLKKRIDDRVDSMMRNGFIGEVEDLRSAGYGAELNSMNSIGYRELNDYIDGKLSFEDAVTKIKTESKRYAKRQMTWYRKNKNIHWFGVSEPEKVKELLYTWIADMKK